MNYSSIGKNTPRIDAIAKVTGMAQFTADLHFPRELFVRLVRSTQGHANIVNIDIEKARQSPGVRGIITGEDCDITIGTCIMDQPPLAKGKVRFVGEPIVAVVADCKENALLAEQLIHIEYDPLPVILETEDAMKQNAPLIHETINTIPGFQPHPQTNIFHHYKIRKGDVEKTFATAQHIVKGDVHWPHLAHCQLEPHAAIARWNQDNTVEIYSTAQSPYDVRKFVVKAFQLPMQNVSATTYCLGGGFGGKSDVTIEPLAVWIAKHFKGEYIRIQLEREEMFYGTVLGRGLDGYYEVAFDDQGNIQAMKVDYRLNAGAYASYAIAIVQPGGITVTGSYYVPNLQVDAYGVYTNKPPIGAFRAYGHPESVLIAENAMDKIAAKLQLDPFEVRRKNLIQVGQKNSIGQTVHKDDGNIVQCMDIVVQDIQQYNKPILTGCVRGIGLSNLLKAPGMPCNGFSSAIVRFNEDATVHVSISAIDMGQGLLTAITQIAAEALQIDINRIKINTMVDTRYTPYEWQTVGSRSTWMVGNAVYKAAMAAIEKIKENASFALGHPPQELIYDGTQVYYQYDHTKTIPLEKLTLGYTFPNGRTVGSPPMGTGSYVPETEYADLETGQGDCATQWTYGCQGIVADIDTSSGQIHIRLISSALDIGKVINPILAKSQVQGAAIMGLGGAIMEGIVYDKNGTIRNTEFTDYKIPTPEDAIPIDFQTHFLETPDQTMVYGAKCLAEHPIIGIAPAILSAVQNATGCQWNTLPLQPSTIRAKILEKEK
jgi:carbon-monoxide dehydrogenase large subunit